MKGIKGRKQLSPVQSIVDEHLSAPLCETCGNMSRCSCAEENMPGCKYRIMGEDELSKRLLIMNCIKLTNRDKANNLYPPKIQRDMMNRYWHYYHGTLRDITDRMIDERMCPDCEGTGMQVGATIGVCERCNGSGIIDKDVDPNYYVVYIIYEDSTPFDVEIKYVSRNKTDIRDRLETMNNSKDAIAYYEINNWHQYHYGRMLMNKKLFDDDITDKELNELFFGDDTEFVAFTSVRNEIVTVGTLEEIQNYFGIKRWQDVEKFFSGTIQVVSKEKFSAKYEIKPMDFMAELYTHALSDFMMFYIYNASYTEAGDLWSQYVNTYNTLTKIQDNIMKYAVTDDPVMIIANNTEILEKIIKDFSYVGITITKNSAANVIKLVESMVKQDVIPTLTNYNAVAVFITEYIMISQEYATITAGSDNL